VVKLTDQKKQGHAIKILSSDRAGRLRPKTSKPHRLKDSHIRLWQYLWGRSRVLPDEQYYDSQLAAARHFGVDQSTISRRVAVLIENSAVLVLKDTHRNAEGFWTSKVVKVTQPSEQDHPHAELHADKVVEKADSASTCNSASMDTVCSPISNKNYSSDSNNYGLPYTVSDAEMHADKVVENMESRPHAEMHVDRANLGTRILAAHQRLTDYETAAASSVAQFGNDCGWGRSIASQRAEIIRLENKLAAIADGTHELDAKSEISEKADNGVTVE
jgi:hypothetical protein